MPKRLHTLSIGTPGWRGLNKQQAGGVLPPGWATKALNYVIDDQGRMTARNGTRAVATAGIGSTNTMQTLHYYLDRNGTEVLIGAGDNKIWRLDGTTWTDVTGTATTPTADNWKFANFNGKVVGWQTGHSPVVMATTAGTFADIVASSGTVPQGSTVLAAWGRVWALDKDTLYFSDLLDETAWTGGTAGSLILTNAWPSGVDTPVALAEFNNSLVIFGKTSLVIYGGPDDPASPFSQFVKEEGIGGIGCRARDSVQEIGEDVLFLSNKGMRRLGRVIQEKSKPTSDAAVQVRDFVLQQVQDSTADDVKSAYASFHGFYILVLKNTTLVFDLRATLDDGSFRVTEWDPGFRGAAADEDGKLVIAFDDQAYRYQNRKDFIASDGTGGEKISIDFEGVWNDFETAAPGLGNRIKYMKRVKVFINGGAGQTLAFRWYVDYKTGVNQRNIIIPAGKDEAIWGVARYSQDYYSGDFSFNTKAANAAKGGRVLKVGIRAELDNVPFSLDRIDVYVTTGKLSL